MNLFKMFIVALVMTVGSLAATGGTALAEGAKCSLCGKAECGEKCDCAGDKNCGKCQGHEKTA